MAKYDHKKIERKWQGVWEKTGIFKTPDDSTKGKEYVLDFFPYPSGEGLHVGHLKGYSATDIYAHLKRRQGYNVLHPMGWDAFGLPAENYAIKKGIHPAITTENNIKLSKEHLKHMGFSYDWDREINTTDPNYYKWTQWIFIKLFEKGLAYEAEMPINWCPSCKTGLANEEVINGGCERCGTEVTKKNLRQWVLKITKYADRLLSDLDGLDWPEPIKLMQRNWIGRSEGAEVLFKTTDINGKEHDLWVFTTRPDTLFGATFMVLAPEHALVNDLATKENKSAVEKYVNETKKKSDLEREELDKAKTGVFTGSYAINPVNGEKIPIWIADYVMMGYGHGAIMAVPAHDQRDWDFAKKFGLQIKQVVAPICWGEGNAEFKKGSKIDHRNLAIAIIKHWAEDKYFCLDWKGFNWKTFVIGGVEDGESFEEAAVREAKEESGYQNFKTIKSIGGTIFDKFYATHKKTNRVSEVKCFLIELKDGKHSEIAEKDKEFHTGRWVDRKDIPKFIDVNSHIYYWNELTNPSDAFVSDGEMINSQYLNGLNKKEAIKKVVSELSKKKLAKTAIQYKLRDWLFSRQRYWGEPIPIVHCEKCGLVPVPEKELPLKLPDVKKYEPTGTGESPLASITDWVNTKCPKCDGPGKRETNTMPQWAGSCWYYIRFIDPKNDKALAGKDKMRKWLPVDFYVGGAEHAVLHLLYARFWHKFLYDIGVVPTKEPFQKLRNVGLILAEDGGKMSKSRGNIVNPNVVIEKNGADTLRMYEMFMGPFEQPASWNTKSLEGISRFLARVWGLFDGKIEEKGLDLAELRLLNKTIKKVGEDIENFRFNTAISALMILVNSLTAKKVQTRKTLEILCLILAPFAPHMTEELWEKLGFKESVHVQAWPKYDPKMIEEDTAIIVVQVNGKVRANIEMSKKSDQKDVEKEALDNKNVKKFLESKAPKKIIYIPNKILNIVI